MSKDEIINQAIEACRGGSQSDLNPYLAAFSVYSYLSDAMPDCNLVASDIVRKVLEMAPTLYTRQIGTARECAEAVYDLMMRSTS